MIPANRVLDRTPFEFDVPAGQYRRTQFIERGSRRLVDHRRSPERGSQRRHTTGSRTALLLFRPILQRETPSLSSHLASAFRAVAASAEQHMVTHRTPADQTAGPSPRGDQQDQQDDNDRHRRIGRGHPLWLPDPGSAGITVRAGPGTRPYECPSPSPPSLCRPASSPRRGCCPAEGLNRSMLCRDPAAATGALWAACRDVARSRGAPGESCVANGHTATRSADLQAEVSFLLTS